MHTPPPHISIVVNDKIIYQNFTAIYDQEGLLFMVFYQEMLQMKQLIIQTTFQLIIQTTLQRGHQADIIYDNKTQLVEKGGSSFFKGGGGGSKSNYYDFFYGSDYVTELTDSPRNLF